MDDQDDIVTVSLGSGYTYSDLTITGGSTTNTITMDSSTYPVNYNYTCNPDMSYSPTSYITVGRTCITEDDIVLAGKSLVKSLDAIEKRLVILNGNPELETKWDSLRQIKEQYEALEKEILEKEKLMEILKR
jgi:hypothetical protein